MNDELARVRSAKDAELANSYAKAAAQVAILINGGAATAVLAFLANAKRVSPSLALAASSGMIGYAVGVALGTLAMGSMWLSAEGWAEFWTGEATDQTIRRAKGRKKGMRWRKFAQIFFSLSMLAFIIVSIVLGIELLQSFPNQSITQEHTQESQMADWLVVWRQ